MADEQASSGTTELEVPPLPPGTLTAVEVSAAEELELSDDEQTALKALCRTLQQRDKPAYREQIIRTWEKRWFDRGFQHNLPQKAGGWTVAPQYNPLSPEYSARSIFETNIYNSYGQMIIAALTREVPTPRFRPVDRNNDADITASEAAEKLKKEVELRNKMRSKLAELARFLWTDGEAIFETMYVKDGQRFGYEDQQQEEIEQETVPEDEERLGQVRENGSGISSEQSSETGQNNQPVEPEREPKGREVICVLGALEVKLPIKADCLAECAYAQISREIDLQTARAKYPKYAAKIKAASGGPGGDDIDRLARINVRLGVMDQYITTDSQAYDVTEQKTWIRPSALLEVAKEEIRNSLIEKAGTEGLRVIFCGEQYCECRSLSMDDQLTLVHALPGDGMHRPGLGDWLMPIQKVLNNWLELADDYFIRGVPNMWMDNEVFDVEKLRDQVNLPGAKHPAQQPQDGTPIAAHVFMEEALPFPQFLWEFIQFFHADLAQLLCGAYPALSGGGDTAPTDTATGMMIQRDQALGRLGLPWRNIKEAVASVFQQAVMCLARNSEGTVDLTEDDSIRVDIQDLKGNFMAYAEVDENFPESWTQKQNRMALLVQDAMENPLAIQLLDDPSNLETLKDGIGLEDLVLPQLESRDKQLGENTILLRSGPTPNPALQQAEQQLEALQGQAKQSAAAGVPIDPQSVEQATQLQQQMQQIPPMISSVEIDEDCDNHQVEAATVLRVINSPRGRELKNGSPDEQAGFQNLRLHYLEHKAVLAKNQQEAPKKPVNVSANVKDLPPITAAAAATMAGLPAKPEDFVALQAEQAAEKHPGPGGVTVK